MLKYRLEPLKIVLLLLVVHCANVLDAQVLHQFAIEDLNTLIRDGVVEVAHSPIDIGSIYDVFDYDPQTLARSANVNPFVITIAFPFKVKFSGSEVLQSYGDGWWTLEAADTQEDLINQNDSYVKLVDMSMTSDGTLSSILFLSQSKKIIQLTVRRTTGDDYVHLNEWQLLNATAEVEIESVCAQPSEVWLLPDAETDVQLTGYDLNNLPYVLSENVTWSLDSEVHVSLTQLNDGVLLTSTSETGTAILRADFGGYVDEIIIHVVQDFKPIVETTQVVKVALVIIDPPIEAENGLRFHQRFGWDDPVHLANSLADSLNAVSDGAVDYQIISTYDESILYAALQGTFVTVDSMYRLFLEPGWATFRLLEQTGGFAFDYNGLLEAHSFCQQSNEKQIDEVWVYSMPFTGMYESRLTGDGAFWYNAPPLDGNECVGQLPIMGFNYERGVAEAMHSFGHRVESAMVHVYGRWDYQSADKNDWELFASYDEAVPDSAHIGNIHFPPNGISDYDYENPSYVNSFSENWKYYPFLFDQQRQINCSEWNCTHLGFMSWWFRHLPHFACKNKEGLLNNWWPYIVDYNEGKELEQQGDHCNCKYVEEITRTEEQTDAYPLKIFPTPASHEVFVELLSEPTEDLNFLLYQADGKRIIPAVVKSGNQFRLDLQVLPSGLYCLTILEAKRILASQRILIMNN